MPTVEEAVRRGILREPERKILEVITLHNKYVFSTALEDLSQLAKWCADPSLDEPLDAIDSESTEPITINTKFELLVTRGCKQECVSTYTLRTVSTALASLARSGRIWRGKLFFSDGKGKIDKGRIYYGVKGIDAELDKTFDALKPTERSAKHWITMEPDDAIDDN